MFFPEGHLLLIYFGVINELQFWALILVTLLRGNKSGSEGIPNEWHLLWQLRDPRDFFNLFKYANHLAGFFIIVPPSAV